jgi:hypothetical protein
VTEMRKYVIGRRKASTSGSVRPIRSITAEAFPGGLRTPASAAQPFSSNTLSSIGTLIR